MATLLVNCPYCRSDQQVDHPGNYTPVYTVCSCCDKRFIVEPVRDGILAYKTENAPCCSQPDCRSIELGASGNE